MHFSSGGGDGGTRRECTREMSRKLRIEKNLGVASSEDTRALRMLSFFVVVIVCAHLNKKYFNDDDDDRARIVRMCDAFIMFEIK